MIAAARCSLSQLLPVPAAESYAHLQRVSLSGAALRTVQDALLDHGYLPDEIVIESVLLSGERAAAVERQRLLEHTRREIDMRMRIARRELLGREFVEQRKRRKVAWQVETRPAPVVHRGSFPGRQRATRCLQSGRRPAPALMRIGPTTGVPYPPGDPRNTSDEGETS
mgnify:CR=1 FL=1